jgi:signal transduction histidine kinase
LARHLGVPVIAVRIALVVLLGFSGLGLMLYAAFWAVLPQQIPTDEPPARRDFGALLPFAAIGVGVILLQSLVFSDGPAGTVGWLVAIIAVGAGVIWHQSDPTRRGHWADNASQTPWLAAVVAESDRRSFLFRFIGGGVLVAVGIIGLVAVYAPARGGLTSVFNGLIFALVGLLGVGVVVAPLLWRTFNQLRAEREGRIREQERAEVAAMVHDQVLHTLALIQRNSTDIKEVQRLARGQERSLRNWLYKPTASPTERFAAALEEAAAEVEDTYAITVETVVVGDTDCNDRVAALVAAAREALVNTARHSGMTTVSLYAEVEADELSVFVRDRGAGFDVDTVDETRHGVRGSIIGRMQRHGGRAEIRSAVGDGTEVRLTMPASARESVGAAKETAR